jgi:subtilisin family serine protease
MSYLRKIQRLWGRKAPRATKTTLCVEQLETRDVPSAVVNVDSLVHAAGAVSIAGAPGTPNDPKFGLQWDMQNIHVSNAWSITTGSAKTVVAVLDTGVDYDHPDLYQNIWINQQEIPLSRLKNLKDVDQDGIINFYDLNNPVNQGVGKITDVNHDGRIDAGDILAPMVLDSRGNDTGLGGWAHHSTQDGDTQHPDDLVGWNFVANNNNPFDDNGHGTHVSGTIGAMGNNGIGIAGINWSVQIMALKFLDSTATGTISNAVAALNYSVAHGASITNNSWTGGGNDPNFLQALENARAHGQIFVVAAGNDSQNLDATPGYPASFKLENMISVAATDQNNQLASFSNYGAGTVDLAAPGVNTLSTTPNGQYEYWTGTSMATPHVTGVLALLKSVHPDWTYSQLIGRVLQTVDPIAGLNGKLITGGLLDAAAALADQQTTFINHLYSDLLGHAPTTADLNSWLRALNTGVSRARVAQSVWESTSHRGREIDADCVLLLHHHVDSVHLNQWLRVFTAGGTESDVLRAILTSSDYWALHPSNVAYVKGVYSDLLGRAPTATELNNEVQKLSQTNGRATVAEDVLDSREYLGNLVEHDYRTFLNRGVDGVTQSRLVASLQSGADTPESVAVAILASDEYFQKK